MRLDLSRQQPEDRVFQHPDPYHRGHSPGSSLAALIGFLGLCLLVGLADVAASAQGFGTWFNSLARPRFMPPNFVFFLAWMTLFPLSGVAGWLIWRRIGPSRPLRLWGWQLLAAALWPPALFALHSLALGLVLVLAGAGLGLITLRAFLRHDRLAAALLVPHLVWSGYVACLIFGLFWWNAIAPMIGG